MATTIGYTIKQLLDRGKRWLQFWLHDTPERKIAAEALDARGYGAPDLAAAPADPTAPAKPAKPAKSAPPHEPTEHERGLALYDAFALSQGSQTLAGGDRAVQTTAESDAEAALRKWVRSIQAEIVSIRREESAPVLATLQTLGELTTLAGLNASAQGMIDFLKSEPVLAALAKYKIGKADQQAGQACYDAWWTARTKAISARAGHGTATGDKRKALEDFEAWLNKWWGISDVRLEDYPEILAALGVESKRRVAAAPVPVVQPPVVGGNGSAATVQDSASAG